jgi:hypothetical protein
MLELRDSGVPDSAVSNLLGKRLLRQSGDLLEITSDGREALAETVEIAVERAFACLKKSE